MSAMGMFAAALGGAAGAINQQATGDIEQQRKTDLMQVQAELERSKLQFADMLAGNRTRTDHAWKNAPETVAVEQRTANSNALANARNVREATVATVGDAPYQEAVRGQADRDASAAAARERNVVKEKASDLTFLASDKAIKLNDPEVLAKLDLLRAQANHSNASSGLIGIQTKAGKLELDDKTKLSGLYDEALGLVRDANLTDEERAKKFAPIQQQIVLMKSKSGAGGGAAGGRNPELDTETVKEMMVDGKVVSSETTRKIVRKPGSIGADAGSGPAVGEEVNGFVFKGGNPNDKNNWTPKAQNDKQGRGDQAKPAVSPKQAARDEYLRELKVLDDMRSGLLMPTPQGNERQIADQEEKVNRLLRAAN